LPLKKVFYIHHNLTPSLSNQGLEKTHPVNSSVEPMATIEVNKYYNVVINLKAYEE